MEDNIGAANTLKASRWQVLKARWLGQKVSGEDDGHKVTGYWYGGKLYMTDYTAPPNC